jgi:flagellin-like hook-associated protein FlgL
MNHFTRRSHSLAALERRDHSIERQLTHMATQEEVTAITTEVEKVATDLGTVQSTLQTEINNLAAANPSVDLSGLQTAVAPLDAAVEALGNLQPIKAEPAPTP